MNDIIYRSSAITLPVMPKEYRKYQTQNIDDAYDQGWYDLQKCIEQLPSAQPEPLTDKEQRIFLAAMGREEKVCEEVDRNHVRQPYEDSLIRVCKEIRRKVKGALWT